MRKQFYIPPDTNESITYHGSKEGVTNSFSNHPTDGEEDFPNSFSNHPTGRTKWSRDILVGKKNPLFNENNGRR